jgi:hypothetical protein
MLSIHHKSISRNVLKIVVHSFVNVEPSFNRQILKKGVSATTDKIGSSHLEKLLSLNDFNLDSISVSLFSAAGTICQLDILYNSFLSTSILLTQAQGYGRNLLMFLIS